MITDSWAGADAYERYIGRWSRPVAGEFLDWIGAAPGLYWLDVGCGTGALSAAIRTHAPAGLVSLDRSFAHAAAARASVGRSGVQVIVADGCELPLRSGHVDHAVSGLVLNFVPEPARMLASMRNVTRPGGRVAVYVWDYGGRMEMLRHFWDAVVELDPRARDLDEAVRFPLCRPDPLRHLFLACNLAHVELRAIDVSTVFCDFDDYWQPFLGGQGPAPGYVATLDDGIRSRLAEAVRSRLPQETDGSIHLVARAWAAKGVVRGK